MEPILNNDVQTLVDHYAALRPDACILVRDTYVYVIGRKLMPQGHRASVLQHIVGYASANEDSPDSISAHDCISLLLCDGYVIVRGGCHLSDSGPCKVCPQAAERLYTKLEVARRQPDVHSLLSGFGLIVFLQETQGKWAVRTWNCMTIDELPLSLVTWFYTRQQAQYYLDGKRAYGMTDRSL